MEQNNSTVLLLGTGALLVIVGALLSYVFMPPQIVEIASTQTETQEPTESSTYAWHAPDDYEAEVRTYDVMVPLPEPDTVGTVPLETTLQSRRSVRAFAEVPLSLEHVAQMLWAGIGQSSDDGKRTSPSPGSANPTRIFLVAENVQGLEPGLYEYLEEEHALGLVRLGSHASDWEDITHQTYPMNAPAVMLITGDMYKHYDRHGVASERLVLQESGHIGQNLYLQAETLGLGMVVMGGFDTVAGQKFLGTPAHEPVVYLVPFGNRG